jgi:hypothetical protein
MINCLLSINKNQVEQFLDNFRFDGDGNRLATDFPEWTSPAGFEVNVYDIRQCYLHLPAQGQWKDDTSGPQDKQLVVLNVIDFVEPDWTDPQDPDPADKLTVLHYLRETFPGAVTILDCFKQDGFRHGQTLIPAERDENGDIITPEQITGNPTYPPIAKADMLLYMPDNEDETPATDYKEVNTNLGSAQRRYE